MAGMSYCKPGSGLVRCAVPIFLFATFLFSPFVSLHAQQDENKSSAAIESGRVTPTADSAVTQAQGRSLNTADVMDDAIVGRIHSSELVARVKITGVHRMIDNALSEPGMVAILGYVYSGVAQKVWKGEPGKLVAFRLTLDDCDRKLKRGGRYLIFAEADTQGRLQLSSCEAVIEDSAAANLLAQLDSYYQG